MLHESYLISLETHDELPPLRSESFKTHAPVEKTEFFNLDVILHGLDQIQKSFLKNTSNFHIDSPSPRIVKHFKHCIDGLRNSYQQMRTFQTDLTQEFVVTGMSKLLCEELLTGLVKSLHLVEEAFQLNQWENFVDRVEFRLLPLLHHFTGSLTQVLRSKVDLHPHSDT